MAKKIEFDDPAFLVEIAYKSGYSFQMWFIEFEIDDSQLIWKVPPGRTMPILLGIDNIISVIQLDIKEVKDIPKMEERND